MSETTTIGFLLYPRFTALDIIGPYEVLARLPSSRCLWIAQGAEPVRADAGATIVPDVTFAAAPPLDIVVVPGGPGTTPELSNPAIVDYIARAAAGARTVASVCTGSLLLAKAGLLTGKRATTHWLAREALAELGAQVVHDRVVRDGDVITAAGVSAGIDLALRLVADLTGDFVAQAIQLGIEYDPQPPFDAGAPEKAPPEVAEVLRANARQFLS